MYKTCVYYIITRLKIYLNSVRYYKTLKLSRLSVCMNIVIYVII